METENNTEFKWCVEVTDDNREIVGKWFNENGTTGYNCYHKDIYTDIQKYLGFPKRSASHYFSEKEVEEHGYKIISFEEFKKDVLKMENNSKQILGYKIKEDCKKYESAIKEILSTASLAHWWDKNAEKNLNSLGYNFQTSAECHSVEGILRKANILEAWFSPVYSNEYKVGDWVVVKSWKQGGDGNGIDEDNLVSQLYKLNSYYGIEDGGGVLKGAFKVKYKNKYYSIESSHIIRKATEEEIKANKSVVLTIGASDIKVTISKGKIVADNKEINAESLSKLVHNMDGNKQYNLPWNVGFGSTVTIGCSTFKQGELNQVLEEYDVINNTSFALLPF